jgi:exonuclease III
MILVTLNIRGVGGPLKQTSLHRLLNNTSPSIIFLQETMVSADKARSFLYKLRPEWMTCVVSSVGTSGGLLASWDPNLFSFDPFLSTGGILLSGYSLADKRKLIALNVYGPCQDRKYFWASVEASGILAQKDIIIVGDLNFTTSPEEIWGHNALQDPLAGFFKSLFLKNSLVDVLPSEIVPTWRNDRAGIDSISKRLDRFLIAEELLATLLRGLGLGFNIPFLSDHAPVFLELGLGFPKVAHPFKLNSVWIIEESFELLVKDVWLDPGLAIFQVLKGDWWQNSLL